MENDSFKLLKAKVMYADAIGESVTFQLKNIAYQRFDRMEDFINIISPFARMYLITAGEGYIMPGKEKINLEAGHIYLIPSFTPCTYVFYEGLCQYYIHFTSEFPNGLKIYNLYQIKNKEVSDEIVPGLFKRLLEINPDLELPHHDPNVYQKKPWVNKKVEFRSVSHHLETMGILGQLFSRFLIQEQNPPATSLLRYNIQPILLYIQNNLSENISVNKLAEMSYFSKDHFTRVFKSLIGIPPCEFIIRKRIEMAQLLLLTTDMTQSQIIEEAGFRSVTYFSRIFHKYTSYTPAEYKNLRG